MRIQRLLICAAFLMGMSPAPESWASQIQVVRAFPELEFTGLPLLLTSPPKSNASSNRVFVVEQNGKISVFANSDVTSPAQVKTFLDLAGTVNPEGGEQGMLGLAFAPDFAISGEFFVSYTDPQRAMVVARGLVSKFDPDLADKSTITQVIRVPKKLDVPNHNAGMLAFGPKDGMLYVSTGDGGGAGDPMGNAQKKSELLGKMLRLDVSSTSAAVPYKIPADNPFIKEQGSRGEIWAYGLRNVWRYSFDRVTGALWAGDVGQDQIEEIDLIVKGGNYGWNILEGNQDFKNPLHLPTTDFIGPVITYKHSAGVSITGGYVYRGKNVPLLAGLYVYGDFATGTIWALKLDSNQVVVSNTKIASVPALASFGEDSDGELLAVSLSGQVYRFIQK